MISSETTAAATQPPATPPPPLPPSSPTNVGLESEQQPQTHDDSITVAATAAVTLAEEQAENLNKLLNNVNYGIVLAFFEKFSFHLDGLKDITVFKNFEASLTNKKISKHRLQLSSFVYLF